MLTRSGKVHQQGDANEKDDDRNPEMAVGEDCSECLHSWAMFAPELF
jgi:hypothetical protein